LQVLNDGDRRPLSGSCLTNGGDRGRMRLVGPVREVQPSRIHPTGDQAI
jgi:hypothetical protein